MHRIVRRGFTLVELLFSVALLALVVAMMIVVVHFLVKWW